MNKTSKGKEIKKHFAIVKESRKLIKEGNVTLWDERETKPSQQEVTRQQEITCPCICHPHSGVMNHCEHCQPPHGENSGESQFEKELTRFKENLSITERIILNEYTDRLLSEQRRYIKEADKKLLSSQEERIRQKVKEMKIQNIPLYDVQHIRRSHAILINEILDDVLTAIDKI